MKFKRLSLLMIMVVTVLALLSVFFLFRQPTDSKLENPPTLNTLVYHSAEGRIYLYTNHRGLTKNPRKKLEVSSSWHPSQELDVPFFEITNRGPVIFDIHELDNGALAISLIVSNEYKSSKRNSDDIYISYEYPVIIFDPSTNGSQFIPSSIVPGDGPVTINGSSPDSRFLVFGATGCYGCLERPHTFIFDLNRRESKWIGRVSQLEWVNNNQFRYYEENINNDSIPTEYECIMLKDCIKIEESAE